MFNKKILITGGTGSWGHEPVKRLLPKNLKKIIILSRNDKGQVGISDFQMTRFFLTLEEAISLLFKAKYESVDDEIFVMKMPTCKITDLAQAVIDYSDKKGMTMVELWKRPGEKLNEILFSEYESATTVYFNSEYLVILPTIEIKSVNEHYANYEKVEYETYSTENDLMTNEEIHQMLVEGGFSN